MSKKAFVTVVTRNYLAYAKAVMAQCQRHEPDAQRFVVVADRLPKDANLNFENATIVYADQLGIANWHRYSFQYTPFELSCALKPHAISYVTGQHACSKVIYLDGDMGLYGAMTTVWNALDNDSIVLTPHLLGPLPSDGMRPHESTFFYSGAYNAGFFAVSNSSTAQAFIEWWKSMLDKNCFVDLAAGQFVDQKWLGMVPGMFDGVRILRNYGINAGHWTLSQAKFEHRSTAGVSESDLFIKDDPLVLFHFSGMTPHKPTEYLQSQNRTSLHDIPRLKSLCEAFHQDVHQSELAECTKWGSAFDVLSDGTPIHPGWREAIRRDESQFAAITNPFDVHAHSKLKSMFHDIEKKSYKWRRDWRLKWQKDQGVKGVVRKGTSRIRDSFRVVRAFLKASF